MVGELWVAVSVEDGQVLTSGSAGSPRGSRVSVPQLLLQLPVAGFGLVGAGLLVHTGLGTIQRSASTSVVSGLPKWTARYLGVPCLCRWS